MADVLPEGVAPGERENVLLALRMMREVEDRAEVDFDKHPGIVALTEKLQEFVDEAFRIGWKCSVTGAYDKIGNLRLHNIHIMDADGELFRSAFDEDSDSDEIPDDDIPILYSAMMWISAWFGLLHAEVIGDPHPGLVETPDGTGESMTEFAKSLFSADLNAEEDILRGWVRSSLGVASEGDNAGG